MDFGGRGFNVSRLLKGVDAPSFVWGFLAGNAGELLYNGLKNVGISTAGALSQTTDGNWLIHSTNVNEITPIGARSLIESLVGQARFEKLDLLK